MCMHKFACTNVTHKRKEKYGGETLTDAATCMSNDLEGGSWLAPLLYERDCKRGKQNSTNDSMRQKS